MIYKYWETKKINGGSHSKMMGNKNVQKQVIKALKQRINFENQNVFLESDDTFWASADEQNALTSVTAIGASAAELYIDDTDQGDIADNAFSAEEAVNGSYSVTLTKNADSNYIKVLADIIDGEASDSLAVSFLADEYTLEFDIDGGAISTKPMVVDNIRSVSVNGSTKVLWDADASARSYKIYSKKYGEDEYTYLGEASENEYQSDVAYQDGFSENCTMFYVIPVFDDYEGGFDACAYNFEYAVAEFSYEIDADNKYLVHFTDTSQGENSSWEWDFDSDGVIDSTEQNPDHVFSDGKYSVTLTVSGDSGSDTTEMYNLIKIGNYIERLEISSDENVLKPGETANIEVDGITTAGDVVKLTDNLNYWVSDEDILTVDDGSVIGVSGGNATLSVQYEDMTASYEFAVTETDCAVYSITQTDTGLTAKIYNKAENSLDASIILTFYDYDDRLISAQGENTVLDNGKNTVEFDVDDISTAYQIKVYVWNNIDKMKPLCKKYTLDE